MMYTITKQAEKEIKRQAAYEYLDATRKARQRYEAAAACVTDEAVGGLILSDCVADWLWELSEAEKRAVAAVRECIGKLPEELRAAAERRFLDGGHVQSWELKRIVKAAGELVPEYFLTRTRARWIARAMGAEMGVDVDVDDFEEAAGW